MPRCRATRVASAAIAAASVVGVACSLTTSFDDLTGGAGGRDAAPVDVAVPLDAGPDGAGGADAAGQDARTDTGGDAARPPCLALFCADWDESSDPTHGWDGTEVNGGGSIGIDTTNARSTPNAFASAMAPGSGYDGALLTQRFPFTAKEMHLDVYVRFEQLDDALNTISIAALGLVGQTIGDDLRLRVRAGAVELVEEYADPDAGAQINVASGAYASALHEWIEVRVDASLVTRTATMTFGGTLVGPLTLQGAWNQPQTVLKVGVYYSLGASGGQRFLYDDLAFDAK